MIPFHSISFIPSISVQHCNLKQQINPSHITFPLLFPLQIIHRQRRRRRQWRRSIVVMLSDGGPSILYIPSTLCIDIAIAVPRRSPSADCGQWRRNMRRQRRRYNLWNHHFVGRHLRRQHVLWPSVQ